MTRKVLSALALVVVVAVLLMLQDNGRRVAFAVGDLPPNGGVIPPSVFIIYDTSANQNASMGTATAPNNHLNGYSGPVKKYMAFQVVLTGDLISPAGGGALVPGARPGLLDLHIDDMFFGFAGIDQKTSTTTNSAGGFSYGPNDVATLKYTWVGAGITVVPVSPVFTGNQGLRHAPPGITAADFPMRKIFTSADKTIDTNAIQATLLTTGFGANNDALMDSFRDAYHYYTVDYPAMAAGKDCGDKFVIYVGAGVSGASYTDMNYWIDKLKEEGVIVYVTGLVKEGAPSTPAEEAYYDYMALRGGGTCANSEEIYGAGYGHCAFIARGGACSGADPNCDLSGASDLNTKLGSVFALILNQVTSRTSVATSDAPILSAADGQWRMNAFFQTFPAGGAWHGFLRAGKVVGTGPITETIEFDAELDARTASDRRILTSDGAGGIADLSAVLASDYGAFIATQLALHTPTKPCIAHAFFDSPSEWYRMLSGGVADNLVGADCAASAGDKALVQGFQAKKLGDIYHSSPTVVGPPELFLADAGYQEFFLDNQNRHTMVYVGANDGMLHAFYLRHSDASKVGQEAWAFVPRMLIEKLPNRIFAHDYYVDGPIITRDVQVARASVDAASWRTVLIAGLGRGGSTYFALDITDPDAPEFLWEYTDPRLALTIAPAATGRVFLGVQERPVAFLSGGWDPAGDPNDGRLFAVLDLFTGVPIKEFDTVAPMTGGPSAYLDMPTTLTSRAYVGDKIGGLWRVDTTAADEAAWTMTKLWPTGGFAGVAYQKPVFFPPSVSLDLYRQATIYYGTGNIEQLEFVEDNYFWGVREVFDAPTETWGAELLDSTNFPITFAAQEKLIGAPVVFNGVVLFTTFTASPSVCGFGLGQLYGVDYLTGEPRLTSTGSLTAAGTPGAVASIGLGPGVPSSPAIRQRPATVAWGPNGQATVAGGQYEAVIQTGSSTRTDELTDTTVAVDLGAVERRADILTIAEME